MNDERPLSPREQDQLKTWEAQAPSADFSARVMASLAAPPAKRRWPFAVVSLAAALWLLVFLWGPKTQASQGSVRAQGRQELSLGGRAIAVAESGAALSWEVTPSREATIIQEQGAVFYRVEPGGPFTVKTSAGDITVKGTCFQVEVTPMKQAIVGGAIGAVLSAFVTVTVYEGKVAVANERGSVMLAAGDTAQLTPQKMPEKNPEKTAAPQPKAAALVLAPMLAAPTDATSREELLKRDAQLRQELAMLQTKVQELEADQGPMKGEEHAFFETPQEELLQMAKDCRLPWDGPPAIDSAQDLAELSKDTGATAEEAEVMKKIAGVLNEDYAKELRGLYGEATGSNPSEDMSPNAMIQEIEAKSNPADIQMAHYLLTQERAGLKTPPSDVSMRPAIERAMRLRVGLGNEFEKAIAAELGATRAHALRGKRKGWSNRMVTMGGCGELNEK